MALDIVLLCKGLLLLLDSGKSLSDCRCTPELSLSDLLDMHLEDIEISGRTSKTINNHTASGP